MLQWELIAGGHIGPGGRSARQRRAGRDGARPLQRGGASRRRGALQRVHSGGPMWASAPTRDEGCGGVWSPRPTGASQVVRSERADVPKAWLPPTKFCAEIWGVGHRHRPRTGEFSPFLCTLWKTSSGKGADRLLTGREKDAILKVYRRGWVWQPGAAGGNARRYAPLAAKECGCVQIQVEPRIVSIRPELFGSGRFSMPRWGKEGRCGDFSGGGRAF